MIIAGRNVSGIEIEDLVSDMISNFYPLTLEYNTQTGDEQTVEIAKPVINIFFDDVQENQIVISGLNLFAETKLKQQFVFDILLFRSSTNEIRIVREELRLLHNYFNKRGSFIYDSSNYPDLLINELRTISTPRLIRDRQNVANIINHPDNINKFIGVFGCSIVIKNNKLLN